MCKALVESVRARRLYCYVKYYVILYYITLYFSNVLYLILSVWSISFSEKLQKLTLYISSFVHFCLLISDLHNGFWYYVTFKKIMVATSLWMIVLFLKLLKYILIPFVLFNFFSTILTILFIYFFILIMIVLFINM